MDGIDVGLVEINDSIKFIDGLTYPFPESTKQQLWEIISVDNIHDPRIPMLDDELGELFTEAVMSLLQQCQLSAKDIIAIGSHGQNISHHPNDPTPYTLQIGNPQIIAAKTGITTVANFRVADVAAGGQGAPLAPLFHQHLLADETQVRTIVNIGGIANVSFLSAGKPVIGFDTGPGNGLMDAWIKQHHHQAYDKNGAWAATGDVDQHLLQQLLADPYFKKVYPKSTGKEYFNLKWLGKFLTTQSAVDVQATLLELTAQSIIQAVAQLSDTANLIICGGGVHNSALIQRLAKLTSNKVMSSSKVGVNPDYLEAMLFAWLAKCRLGNCKLDTRSITGAREKVLLGEVTLAI